MKTKLEHFYSDVNRVQRKEQNHATPSEQTVREAMTLGRVRVGNADIICQDKKYIVVIMMPENGLGYNTYRDMYRIITE